MSMHTYEYIWIGGKGEFRGKTRVLEGVRSLNQVPKWNYDGSSTDQAGTRDSEVILHPVRIVRDPFSKGDHFIVLCETRKPDGTPLPNNYRPQACQVFKAHAKEEPWFGLEQEYFLIRAETKFPIGFTRHGMCRPQGPFYCGVGTGNAMGRDVAMKHMRMCIDAGLKISGINAEVAPGQWEFQIGPVEGIDAADQLLIARYLLERVCEGFDLIVSYAPKLLSGDWNGSGCHTNFSTRAMRDGTPEKEGIEFIEEAILKMKTNHDADMKEYGENNHLRMTGQHETARFDTFTHGKANRGASVRIGNDTYKNKKGYFEDRRPAANANPYRVTSTLLRTVMS